jgi:hypothetical protein
MAAIRGNGSLMWMTTSGLDGVGLSELPALRAPTPFSPLTRYSVRVAWAAADIERTGHRWHVGRELATEPRRWGAEVANERRGHSLRLPDLVFWPSPDESLPVAVVVVRGVTNVRRERAALRAWHASIMAGQYAQVRYLAVPGAATRLQRMAAADGLSPAEFSVGERAVIDESVALRGPEQLQV